MLETQVRSLGQEDPLEKEMATHSSTLAWKMGPTVHGAAASDTTERLHFLSFWFLRERPSVSGESMISLDSEEAVTPFR